MVTMNIGELLPKVGRRWRRPKHTFQVRIEPYQIQPFLIAPVLPGETMKQLLIQSRVVSDPVKNALVGWWLEYYVFYVKHRDLAQRDLMVKMMIEPGTDLSALNSTALQATYHYATSPDWVQKCLEVVVENYFRDEDEAWNTNVHPTTLMPMAHAVSADEDFSDSFMLDSNMPDADPIDTSFQTLEPQQAAWEYLRAMKMTDMTYEQYLATYGVSVPSAEEAHKPELLRYLREWTYPTNTVDPLTGTPTSAMSWSIAERADKDRFFKEPGWIFGVTCIRPKTYKAGQVGTASSMMNDGMTWLPAIMKDDPWTSLKMFPQGTGPLSTVGTAPAGDYWLDIRDLLLYGEQFHNFSGAGVTDANWITIPTGANGNRYASTTDISGLFKTGTAKLIRQDGVVSLAILGTQQDTT